MKSSLPRRFAPLLVMASVAFSIPQASASFNYRFNSNGVSAQTILQKIAEQSGKKITFDVVDKKLNTNIRAETAYSAARQVTQDAGYRLRFVNDTFVVSVEPNKATAKQSAVPSTGALLAKPTKANKSPTTFSLTLRDTPAKEAFEMLAKRGQVNVIVSPDVTGSVTASLYNVDVNSAIDSVAHSAGLLVARNHGNIFISESTPQTGALFMQPMELKSFKIQYTDITNIEQMMRSYLSPKGTLTALSSRNTVVVRDKPQVLEQITQLLQQVDLQPRQILIEAKILEITLTDDETFGVDWQSIARESNASTAGTTGFANQLTSGFFLNMVNKDFTAYLSALQNTGRVRTLSTPKLLVLEDQEAEVIVGDKLGFNVVTTTGTSSTESVEFLESGIILRVNASVDNNDKIMLDIHPEVSTGALVDGLPVQKTTEVTTNLLANSGDEVFIGGLLRRTQTDSQSGVPGVSNVPVVGGLFKRTQDNSNRTETVVIIRPRLIDDSNGAKDEVDELIEETDAWFFNNIPSIAVGEDCTEEPCT